MSGCPECPLLKYVLTPQEQQRKVMYYQQHPAAIVAPPPIVYKPKQMVRTLPPKQPAFSMVPQQPPVSVPPPFIHSSVPVQVGQQTYYRAPVQVCVNQSQPLGTYPNPPMYPPSQSVVSNHTIHYTYQTSSSSGNVWSPHRS